MLENRMIQWRQMEVFIVVVEKGNFSRAAEFLDISATAVGKQINNLEKIAQEPLVSRTTRKMSLTVFGQEYYQSCKKLQSEMEEANLIIRSQNENLHGELRLHTTAFMAGALLLPMLSEFMTEYPGLKIKLTVGDYIPNLVEEDVDMLIGYDRDSFDDQPDLRASHLITVDNVLVASPAYLKKFGTPACLNDLSQHQFVHLSLLPLPLRLTSSKGKVLISDLKTALALGDQRLMCIAASNGMGIAYVGERVVQPDLLCKKLVRILPSLDVGKTAMTAFYKLTPKELPKIQLFLERLKHFYLHRLPIPARDKSLLRRLDDLLRR